jgi:phosphoserine phosphatase RsbU/P
MRLENLKALTDTTLTRLDVDDLLVELLGRVREILDVDTAAVLMLDADAEVLVARAACGIEVEVRQGVRVPLGTGFAGRIAATKEPVRLDHIDATTVANPLLWERGIKVMLGVPLLSGDDVLGVLHVGRLSNRSFGDDDIHLLQVVADRIAGATQTRALAIERAATRLLERSLLPEKLPSCPGLGFAARYVPAEERTVGGDWYDLFMLPSGQLWIVVGDVAGHGVHAAVLMGRIRSALRAYALLDTSPAHVLDLVDRKSPSVRDGHVCDGRVRRQFTALRNADHCSCGASTASRGGAWTRGHVPKHRSEPSDRSIPPVIRCDPGSCRRGTPLDDDHARTRDRRRVLYRRPDRAAR